MVDVCFLFPVPGTYIWTTKRVQYKILQQDMRDIVRSMDLFPGTAVFVQ